MDNSMNLQDFVSETLTQIIGGVKDAQKKTEENLVSPSYKGAKDADLNVGRLFSEDMLKIEYVEFDVALTVSKGTKTKGGIGIIVPGFGVGSHGQSDKENQTLSRIKFKIPIAIPQQTRRK